MNEREYFFQLSICWIVHTQFDLSICLLKVVVPSKKKILYGHNFINHFCWYITIWFQIISTILISNGVNTDYFQGSWRRWEANIKVGLNFWHDLQELSKGRSILRAEAKLPKQQQLPGICQNKKSAILSFTVCVKIRNQELGVSSQIHKHENYNLVGVTDVFNEFTTRKVNIVGRWQWIAGNLGMDMNWNYIYMNIQRYVTLNATREIKRS